MRRNIDIGTLNRDKKFRCILVIQGKFYDDIQGWQAIKTSALDYNGEGYLSSIINCVIFRL
jgi:hypothetical protein